MQAQQALLEQQWPPAMTYHDSLEAATSTAPTLLPAASSSSNIGSNSSSSSSSRLSLTADGGAGRQNAFWQQHVTANGQQQQLLFRGLRVRMGIATGLVAKGNSIKNSAVYKVAQGMYAAESTVSVLTPYMYSLEKAGRGPCLHARFCNLPAICAKPLSGM
jgi:hypothetical protein